MQKLLFNYLKFWAMGYLKRTNPEIVAITGSVGKTSAKEAIFEVLKAKFGSNVRKSYGNLNNETGAPLSILNYNNSPENTISWIPILITAPFKSFFMHSVKILVLELAADKPGDIKYLTSFIKPKIAVLTSIGPSHLEAFGEMKNIIEEKTDLLRALGSEGWAILNIDDENVRKVSYGGKWQKITYSITNEADIRASKIQTKIENNNAKTSFVIKSDDNELSINQNTLGLKANVSASLAAVAVGKIYEISKDDIKNGLERVVSEKHRMNILRGKNDSIIIDDCYNANPVSMKASLESLNYLPSKGRKIAVLGDMREQGKDAVLVHQEVGRIAKNNTDLVIAVGNLAKNYLGKEYFKTTAQASQYLLKEIKQNDIILIKGSRAVGMEEIVERIKL